jgi:membrane protein YqaA with SNARE-associated domain
LFSHKPPILEVLLGVGGRKKKERKKERTGQKHQENPQQIKHSDNNKVTVITTTLPVPPYLVTLLKYWV